MTEFKIGDQVRFRSAIEVDDNDDRWGHGYREGRTATVVGVPEPGSVGTYALEAHDGEPVADASPFRLELVNFSFKVGDRVRFRTISDNNDFINGYVAGDTGVVDGVELEDPHGYYLVTVNKDNGKQVIAFAYRLELDTSSNLNVTDTEEAPARPLVGPKPEGIPVHPTPWTLNEFGTVSDADGDTVLDVYNQDIGELIVKLVHEYVDTPITPKYRYFGADLDLPDPDVVRVDPDGTLWIQAYANEGPYVHSHYTVSKLEATERWTEISKDQLPEGYFEND